MVNDSKIFDGLLEDYSALDESAGTIFRQLKKATNPDNRRKIIKELRNLENRRLELLDQMDSLAMNR